MFTVGFKFSLLQTASTTEDVARKAIIYSDGSGTRPRLYAR